MSTVIQFPCVRPAVCRSYLVAEPEYIAIDGHGDQQFVTSWQLGYALGYVDPAGSVDQLFDRHAVELGWHSFLVDLYQAEPNGCRCARVFDLEGAMRVCKLAKTPAAGMLYARLGARAIADFVVGVGSGAGPRAPVIPFPSHDQGKGVQHG